VVATMPRKRNLGPPGDDDGRPHHRKPATTEEPSASPTPNTTSVSAQPRQCAADTVAGLHRRRRAEQRCEPLHGGLRDPWQPYRPERLSAVQVQAAVDAAEHLLELGYPPLFDFPTLQAMWTAGHWKLVEELQLLTGRAA
jgi:hypothetical protein